MNPCSRKFSGSRRFARGSRYLSLKARCAALACAYRSSPRRAMCRWGAGLSIRFELNDARHVMEVYEQLHPSNLIGFYRVERENGQRTVTRPL